MSIDLSGYNIEFDYTLIPMGSQYWITNAKVGSRYLSQFVSDTDSIKQIKLKPTIEDSTREQPTNESSDNVIISGIKCLATIRSSNGKYDIIGKHQLKSIMDRCSVWVIRNPLDRFISGTIQKTKQFFEELHYIYHNPSNLDWNKYEFLVGHPSNLDWTKYEYFPGMASHSSYPIDYIFLFENYKLINTERINKNDTITIKWFSIWKDFNYYLFTDALKYNAINRSFTGDVHTQPYLCKSHILFNEFNIMSNLEIIDIEDLDFRNDLFERELGKSEYEAVKFKLRNWYSKAPPQKPTLLGTGVVTRTEDEYIKFIRESHNMFKDIDVYALTDYFTHSATYSMEMFTYLMLLKNKTPK